MQIDATLLLLAAGVILLSLAALVGFLQARAPAGSEAAARWRVVHSGGTAGAVQLIALAAVWQNAAHAGASLLALGLVGGTWAFFVGPFARALGREQAARRINLLGALLATPSYVALPFVLLRP